MTLMMPDVLANRATSVGHDWAFEKTLLRPLPSEPFDTALTLTPRVDRYAQVMVRCNQYSVSGPVHRASAAGQAVGLGGDRL